jgi:hypothetical protein
MHGCFDIVKAHRSAVFPVAVKAFLMLVHISMPSLLLKCEFVPLHLDCYPTQAMYLRTKVQDFGVVSMFSPIPILF